MKNYLKQIDTELKKNGENPTSIALTSLYFKNKEFKAVIDGLNYNIILELNAEVFLNETKDLLYGQNK